MDEWNKKRNVMHHYNRIARVYDIQYGDEQKTKIEATLENVSLNKNDFVLDTGCGTGFLFPYIADKVQFLIGIDISQNLLKKAKNHKKRYPNTNILLADVDHLPFQDQTFHTIFAITILQNIPKPSTALQEIVRVSKNHATIAVTGLKKEFTNDSFLKLLKDAKLRIRKLTIDNHSKDYIAICSQSISNFENASASHASGRRASMHTF